MGDLGRIVVQFKWKVSGTYGQGQGAHPGGALKGNSGGIFYQRKCAFLRSGARNGKGGGALSSTMKKRGLRLEVDHVGGNLYWGDSGGGEERRLLHQSENIGGTGGKEKDAARTRYP